MSVCAGGQLALMCNTTNSMHPFLQWNITVPPFDRQSAYVSTVSLESSLPLYINDIFFDISRDSDHGTLPLLSSLSVANVTAALNGTKVDCIYNVERSASELLSNTIHIIGTEEEGSA